MTVRVGNHSLMYKVLYRIILRSAQFVMTKLFKVAI